MFIEFGHIALAAQMKSTDNNKRPLFGWDEFLDDRNPRLAAVSSNGVAHTGLFPKRVLGNDGKETY